MKRHNHLIRIRRMRQYYLMSRSFLIPSFFLLKKKYPNNHTKKNTTKSYITQTFMAQSVMYRYNKLIFLRKIVFKLEIFFKTKKNKTKKIYKIDFLKIKCLPTT